MANNRASSQKQHRLLGGARVSFVVLLLTSTGCHDTTLDISILVRKLAQSRRRSRIPALRSVTMRAPPSCDAGIATDQPCADRASAVRACARSTHWQPSRAVLLPAVLAIQAIARWLRSAARYPARRRTEVQALPTTRAFAQPPRRLALITPIVAATNARPGSARHSGHHQRACV